MDAAELTVILGIPAAAIAFAGMCFAGGKLLRKVWVELFGRPRKAGEPEPPLGLFEATKQNTDDIKVALAELRPNGGASMKDQLGRLEQGAVAVKLALSEQEARNAAWHDEVRKELASLADVVREHIQWAHKP